MKIIKATQPLKLFVKSENLEDNSSPAGKKDINSSRIRRRPPPPNKIPILYAKQLQNKLNLKNKQNSNANANANANSNSPAPVSANSNAPAPDDVKQCKLDMPKKFAAMEYSDLNIEWTQQATYLYLDCVCEKFFFKMPPAWKLDTLGQSRLKLIELILFKDLLSDNGINFVLAEIKRLGLMQTSSQNPSQLKSVGIAFSGGNDSCACVALLPENSTLVYLKRVWNSPKNLIKHTPQLTCLNELSKKYQTYIVDSNIELLGPFCRIKRIGFVNDFVPCIPAILLADMCNLGFICAGLINLYLKDGYQYQDYVNKNSDTTSGYLWWRKLFSMSGLPLVLPVGGCSDRITYNICKKTDINGQPCLRNANGACNKCFKCFRKNFLILSESERNNKMHSLNQARLTRAQFIQRQLNTEVLTILKKRPISRIMTKKLNWISDADITQDYLKLDFEFETKYDYELTCQLVPETLRDVVITKLDSFCQRMNDDDVKSVRNLDLSALLLK